MNNPILESTVSERGTVDQELMLEHIRAIDRQTAALEDIRDAIRKAEVSTNAALRELIAAARFIGNNVS